MKKIVIIGGGIAGLSAGIYAQLNGFQSIILERSANIGGECTGWQREGCYIDGCIHWLTGSDSGEFNNIWKRIGGLENTEIIAFDYMYEYQCEQHTIRIYKDLEKFRNELAKVSSEDVLQIDCFMNYIKAMCVIQMPTEPMDQMNLMQLFKYGKSMMKVGKLVKELSSISVGKYAKRFKNVILQQFMLSYLPANNQLLALIVSIATYTSGNGNVPKCTSLEFSQKIKAKYLSLGGEIKTCTSVVEMKIGNNQVTAVVTDQKQEIGCDYVVPACDVDTVYHKILKNQYNDKRFEQRYLNEADNPILANCYFSYAITKKIAKSLPHFSILECEGIKVANQTKTAIGLKIYDYFNNANGLTTAISPLIQNGDDYVYWMNLYTTNKTKYNAEKNKIAQSIMALYIKHYPELKDNIKVIDTATPVTYNRYYGSYKGSYMAFMLTKNSKQMMHDGRIKKLNNLYMAGQWLITPGGLPTAAVTGKFAIQRICKAERRNFIK